MRRWGIVISLLYALILFGLLVPAAVFLAGDRKFLNSDFFHDLSGVYATWLVWILVGAFVVSQALLLFLSVDTSWKRLRPRMHVAATCAVAGMLFALLLFAAIAAVDAAAKGPILDAVDSWGQIIAVFGVLWVLWGGVFWLYLRGTSEVTNRALTWLLRGSVLELLIVVPSHVIIRRRGDCCAPAITSFGIVTGIAIMLISFGPGILLLYKKRIDLYRNREKLSDR